MQHRITVRVYYEDTDMAGIVYHANYLKYLERGRSEAVRDAGIDQRRLREETGAVFAARRIGIDYLAPARFDDLLTVESRLLRLGAASLDMRQTIRRGDMPIAGAQVRIAFVSIAGRPVRFPEGIRGCLARLVSDPSTT